MEKLYLYVGNALDLLCLFFFWGNLEKSHLVNIAEYFLLKNIWDTFPKGHIFIVRNELLYFLLPLLMSLV